MQETCTNICKSERDTIKFNQISSTNTSIIISYDGLAIGELYALAQYNIPFAL